MNNLGTGSFACLFTIALFLAMQPNAIAENYKCKGADGKIEYSDRPCETSKESLNRPRSAAGVVSAPTIAPMARLDALFADYEPRLCEREKLATEIDMARRSGELANAEAAWKSKQERLNSLNDNMIEFQEKASKVTRGTASDSPEMMAVRKFQSKLKDCAQPKK